MRKEKDFLGEVELPDDFPFGIHTFRASRNFAFSHERIRADLFRALIQVKQAAARANVQAGLLEEKIARAIDGACAEILAEGERYIPPLHPLQGGAGTSTNMAANELIANLALRRLGQPFGRYDIVSPLEHVNLSQSTNDAYPTAVRIALIRGLRRVHGAAEELLRRLQEKEREFAPILKVGRTELQDALPLSLGQEFSAWAEAVSRFRWRLDKALEWVREVNLSGTAVGTGVNADLGYSRRVVEELRHITQEPLALARNLVDATQNADPLVEASGLLKTGAVSVKKMAADLRLLSSGPRCGLGEIKLPSLQAGSSIMPGKVNPVMLEAAEQVCLQVLAGDGLIAAAAAESNLELPQFLPLIAQVLLSNCELFAGMMGPLAETVAGLEADKEGIAAHLNRTTSIAAVLVPTLGYEKVAELVREAEKTGKGILELIREKGLLAPAQLLRLLRPEVLAAPGLPLLEEDRDR